MGYGRDRGQRHSVQWEAETHAVAWDWLPDWSGEKGLALSVPNPKPLLTRGHVSKGHDSWRRGGDKLPPSIREILVLRGAATNQLGYTEQRRSKQQNRGGFRDISVGYVGALGRGRPGPTSDVASDAK